VPKPVRWIAPATWESKEAAEAAEETLVPRREQMAGGVGLTVESADLYEAPVVALEAVHA
jgi:hypothetical protein